LGYHNNTISNITSRATGYVSFDVQLGLSAIQTSSTVVACRGSCTPSYTGSVYLSESHTSYTAGFLPSDLQRHITATTSICQPTTPGRSTLPAKHHRPTGFLCGWSVGMEFLAGAILLLAEIHLDNVHVRFVAVH